MLFVSSIVLPSCIFISHLLLFVFLLFIPTKCRYNQCGTKHRSQAQHCQGSGGCRSKSCKWVVFLWPNLINYVGCFFVFFVIIKVLFCCQHYHHFFFVASLKVIIGATPTNLVVTPCKPTQMELTIVETCKAPSFIHNAQLSMQATNNWILLNKFSIWALWGIM